MGFIDPSQLDPKPAAASAPPTGGRFIDPTEIDPAPPALDDSFTGRLKNNLVAAANTVNPFADEGAAGMRAASGWLQDELGMQRTHGTYDDELAAIRGTEKAYAAQHPYQSGASSVVGALASAPFLPSGIAKAPTLATKLGQAAIEGAGYGGLYGAGNAEGGAQERLKGAATGALLGEAVGPAATLVGEGIAGLGGAAQRLAERVAPPSAEEEAIQSLGISPADVKKAAKFIKVSSTDEPPLAKALGTAKDAGVFSSGEGPSDWLSNNQKAIEGLSGKANGILQSADAAQKDIPDVAFTKAEQFIKDSPFQAKQLKSQFDDRMNIMNQYWDGTVSGLNKVKQAIGNIAYDGLTDSKNLDKAIYTDLKNAVEAEARKLAPAAGDEIAGINQQIGQHYTVRDVLKKAVNKEAAGEFKPDRFSLLSPGVLTAGGLAGSAVTGSLGPLAMAAGASLAKKNAANSGAGRSAISGLLNGGGGMLGGLASVLENPALNGMVAGEESSSPTIQSRISALLPTAFQGTAAGTPAAAAPAIQPQQTRPSGLLSSPDHTSIFSPAQPGSSVFAVKPGQFDPQHAPGMIAPPTITNLYNRPVLHNPDGSVSTTLSTSIESNGKEILIPTVVDGKKLTLQEAVKHFRDTGEHLGVFSSPEAADDYATALHNDQAARMGLGGTPTNQDPGTAAVPSRGAAPTAIKPLVLDTLATVENSRGKTSPKGAEGTFQLMPEIQDHFGVKDPFDDKQAGEAAWKLYTDELQHFHGDPQLAFAAYNLGRPKLESAIRRAGTSSWSRVSDFVPAETRDYVTRAGQVMSRLTRTS